MNLYRKQLLEDDTMFAFQMQRLPFLSGREILIFQKCKTVKELTKMLIVENDCISLSFFGTHKVCDALNVFLDVNYHYRNFGIGSQIEYEKGLIADIKTKPKLLHSYIRHKHVQ